MNILGISFLSDASAAVLKNGKLVAAVSEERLNRTKLWSGIPFKSIEAVFKLAHLKLEDIDLIATHGAAPAEPDPRPFLEAQKKIENSDLPPEIKATQLSYLQKRLEHERFVLKERTPNYLAEIRRLGRPVKVFAHHEAHAASAFWGSGFEEAMVLTADGWGEDGSSVLWNANKKGLERLSTSATFDSLGYYYGSITKALGFVPHRHEGKILGLAAYCKDPKSYETIRGMIDYDKEKKCFVGHMERGYYRPHFENPRLAEFVKGFTREDVSASVQMGLEEVMKACVSDLESTPKKMALAGGIFANVKLNQRIHEISSVSDVYIFPNMGDGGLSVGAAWLAYFEQTGKSPEPAHDMYLGPSTTTDEIEEALKRHKIKRYEHCSDISKRVASLLAEGNVVACHHGRMEFGPRALGHRSILYHATDASVNQWLNERLARSEFMPFAPATLEEYAHEHYIGIQGGRKAAQYMTITFDCTPKMLKESPAAVHVDGTARPQIVSKTEAPWFHSVLTEYRKLTGLSTVINTSFNMHEEPIVCSADDAIRAFVAGRIPYLAIEDFLVYGEEEGVL